MRRMTSHSAFASFFMSSSSTLRTTMCAVSCMLTSRHRARHGSRYYDVHGRLRSVLASWTDVAEPAVRPPVNGDGMWAFPVQPRLSCREKSGPDRGTSGYICTNTLTHYSYCSFDWVRKCKYMQCIDSPLQRVLNTRENIEASLSHLSARGKMIRRI